MAHMRHLIGLNGEYKREASECQQDSVFIKNELNQAKMLIQSERCSAQSVFSGVYRVVPEIGFDSEAIGAPCGQSD